MSRGFISITMPWATYADGRPLRGKGGAFDVLEARIDALEVEDLERCADTAHGASLAEIADVDPSFAVPDGLSTEDEEALYTDHGAEQMRARLKQAVRNIATDRQYADFDFDGRRWHVTTGGTSSGDDPNDLYQEVVVLDQAGVCTAPLDGDVFADVPAVAATVAVLDDLAALTLKALTEADMPAEARAAVERRLEEARCDVSGTAATFRRVLDQVTTDRQHQAWRAMSDVDLP